MNHTLNFFAALSECFCDTFPETLATYKTLLTLGAGQLGELEAQFKVYILANKEAIGARRFQALEALKLFDEIPEINFQRIYQDPVGVANDEVIWAHLCLILQSYLPPDEVSDALAVTNRPTHSSAESFIENLVTRVAEGLPALDETASPQECIQALLRSDAFSQMFNEIQYQVTSHRESGTTEFTPANLLLTATKILMRQSEPPS